MQTATLSMRQTWRTEGSGNAQQEASEWLSSRILMAEIYHQTIDKTSAEVLTDIERGLTLSPIEAKEYGLIDTVISSQVIT